MKHFRRRSSNLPGQNCIFFYNTYQCFPCSRVRTNALTRTLLSCIRHNFSDELNSMFLPIFYKICYLLGKTVRWFSSTPLMHNNFKIWNKNIPKIHVITILLNNKLFTTACTKSGRMLFHLRAMRAKTRVREKG